MSTDVVAGIDSSTQSTKVEVRRVESGEVIGVGRSPHPPTTPPRSEQDPASWWEALADAFSQIDERVRASIGALSVAGQQHGLVMLDASGSAVRPAKLWNDTESAPQAQAMVAADGSEAWVQRCGSVPGPSFTITKLAWVAEHQPDLLDRVAKLMLPHDYLTWRLCGQHVTDRGDASGTGWWSPTSGLYLADLLDDYHLGLSEAVPRIVGPADAAGTLLPDVAERLGLSQSVVVGPGSGDNMAGALGLGLRTGDLAVSVGTSGTAYAVSATPTSDQSGLVAGFADATGNFLPLVCTLNATKVTEAFRQLLAADYDEFDALALQAPTGSGGIVLVPYLDGERTPNRPNATGLMTGLRSDLGRAEVARASFEGVACGLLDGVEALEAAGVTLDRRMFLIGGGARSAAYRRVFSDLSGRTIIVADDDETVATGAAVQAAVVADSDGGDASGFAGVADRWGLGRGTQVEPDSGQAEAAVALRAAYGQARDLGQ